MKSYIAKLIFNVDINNSETAVEFEEQTRIIHANTLKEAWIKAKQIGEAEVCQWLNAKNELLRWLFIDVLEIIALDELQNGQQLYIQSRIENDNQDFKNYVHLKSEWNQKKLAHL